VDGISNLTFTGLNTGQFYVRIHHRNHLQITSSVFIPGTNGIYSYDFTTDASKAMGGENVQKELNTGIWGMMSCDGDANGQIDNKDKNDVWLPQRNTSDYLSGDFNMDRQVSNVDKVSYWEFNAGHGIPQEGLTTIQPFICGDPLIDVRDGQTYNTVQIGTQCWMAENLNIGTRIDGIAEQTDNTILEKYCYDNNTANCETYGGLYQWNEMMQYVTNEGIQGVCPAGWHIPSHNEMCTLLTFLDPTVNCSDIYSHIGTDVGGKMKQTGFEHWMPPNTGATNESGFNALATGWRSTSGFSGIEFMVHYNSSTYINNTGVYIYRLDYNTQDVFLQCDQNPDTFSSGHPIRCIMD
jgi:uncharacterized protein (TIGR02145 family)